MKTLDRYKNIKIDFNLLFKKILEGVDFIAPVRKGLKQYTLNKTQSFYGDGYKNKIVTGQYVTAQEVILSSTRNVKLLLWQMGGC